MGWAEVLAVSPGLPVDDLLAHPEGGPEAAVQAAGALLPGLQLAHDDTRTWAEPGWWTGDPVLVSTFGGTAIFLHPPSRPTVPPGMSTFSLGYQSVSMAWGVDVTGPRFHRLIALSPGVLDYAEGAPLPFEAAFDNVIEESATYSFDDNGFAAAAAQWMFGCHPLEPGPDDRVDLRPQALHLFTAVATPPVDAPPTTQSRPGALRRLLGRG
jgi:hypothetical protein